MLILKNSKAFFCGSSLTLLIMLMSVHAAWAADEPANQRDILTEFYNSTDGDNWSFSGGWLDESLDVCDWMGVTCADDQVTDIELIGNQLSGSVPASIYELPALKNLRLSGNSLTGYSIGNEQACSEFAEVQVGDVVAGELSTQQDCYVASPGRMVERRSLSLASNTMLNFELEFEGDLLPMIGVTAFDDTVENNVGELLALRFNPVGQGISGQVALTAGEYVVFSTSYGSNASSPPIGSYELTLSESAQAQDGCHLATYLVSEGLAIDAEISGTDCVLDEREDLSATELDRHYDQYAFLQPVGSVLNVSISADFDYRIEHLNDVGALNTLLSVSPIVKAGSSRIFNLVMIGAGVNKINVVAVDPEEQGSYSLAIDDYFDDQYDALSSLYNSLGGSAWTDNSGWLDSEVEVCDWYGISCDEDDAVTEINLSNNNLIGSLPSDLELLSRVETLILSDNQINGSIPDMLAAMQDLRNLALQNNQLTGTVPSALYKNNELESLNVTGNSLSETSVAIEFAYTFVASQLGNEGDVLRGVVDAVMLDDSDLFEVVGLQEASLAGNSYDFSELSQWRSAREEIAPYLSLSGDYLDLWVCSGGFSNEEENDCSFGNESGFLISDHWPYSSEPGAVHAGHLNLTNAFRDSDRPIVRENWVARVLTAQRVTLKAFYDAMNGDDWTNNAGWLDTSLSECDWFGVSCVDGQVTDIDLSNNQLMGEVPAAIYQLPSLNNLSLAGNTLTGYALGNTSVCNDYGAIQVGDIVSGNLSNIDDCYAPSPGRMVDRKTLSLDANTILDFSLNSEDFLPLVGVWRLDETVDNKLGDLLALRFNLLGNEITGQVALEAGDYVVFATSQNSNADSPPLGNYTLTLAESAQAQDGCRLATHLVPEGLAVNGAISASDCLSGEHHYDQYTLYQPLGAVLNISVMADFDYRIDHQNDVGEIDKLLGSSPVVPAGQSRIFNLTTEESPWNKISITPVNSGDTGEYFLAIDDYFEDQFDALYSLYNTLGGASWTDSTGWLEDGVDECDWYGITCDGDGIVTDIDLSNNNLVGELPSEIDLLSRLKTLAMNDNALSGAIPAQIGAMQDLISVELQNNLLTSTVPSSLYQNRNLELLNVNGNSLSQETVEIEFAYEFDASRTGTAGHILHGVVDGVMLDDGDTFEVLAVRQASLGGEPFVFGDTPGLRSARIDVAPYLSLSGDYLDFWVCPGEFSNEEISDCSFGAEGGFLVSDHWPNVGGPSSAHAGHPTFEASFRDSDRPINPENWVARVVTAQRVTLKAFYDAMNGDDWTNNAGWLDSSLSECDWFGVSCVDGQVTDIDLSNNQLMGEVPAAIYQLPSLNNLSLAGNTLTGYALGNASVCTDYGAIQVGDIVSGTLSNIDDCFDSERGLLVDRRTLSLASNTILNFTLSSEDFRPFVTVWELDNSAENKLGKLQAVRTNVFGNAISGQVVLAAGDYVVGATSQNSSVESPPVGNYGLTLSESSEAQDGCLLATYLVTEGLAVNGTVSDNDCMSDDHYFDQYTFFETIGTVLNISVMADFDYRIDHQNDAGVANNLLGSSPTISAGQSRVLNITTVGTVANKISITPVNPEDTGAYFLAVDDYFEDQLDALYSLYNALGGASWLDNTGWLEDGVDECDWYGITCDGDGIVTDIDLSANNLSGHLYADFELLSRVRTLALNDNNIGGVVPVHLAAMQDLVDLNLSNNLLTGNVPMLITTIGAVDLSGNEDLGEIVLGDPAACTDLEDLPIAYGVTGVLSQANDCFGMLGDRLADGFSVNLSAGAAFSVTMMSDDFTPFLSMRNPGDETSAVTGTSIASSFAAENIKTNEFVLPQGEFVFVASTAGADSENPPEGLYTVQTTSLAEPAVGCGVDTFVTFGSVANGAISAADCSLGAKDDIVGEDGTRYYDRYLFNLFADTPMYIEFESDFDYRIEHWTHRSTGTVVETLVADGTAENQELFMVELDAFAVHSFVIAANEPDGVGNYTVAFSATEPAVIPDEPAGGTTPPVTETESSISDIENELDDIVVVEGEEVSDEVAQRVGNALNNAGAVAEKVANDLPEGSEGVDLALSALSTIDKSLKVTGSVRQQGGAVDDTAVVNSLGNVAKVFTAMSSRTGTLTEEQKQNVQGITDSTVTNSASMMREESSNDELVALVSATSAVINAAASAGAELTPELAQKTEQLVTKAIKTGMKSFAADIDTEDPAQVEELLRTNPDALEFAVAASVAVTSRIKPDANAIATELSDRGVSAQVSESLNNVLDAVSNPDGVTVGGVSATEALLSALTQLLSGGDASALQAGLNLLAISSGNAQIDVDPLTGGLIITAPNEVYYGSAVNIRMVSNSMPKGISYMRDGRALVVADGLAIEIAPTPADIVGFTAAVQGAGYQLRMRNNGSLEITLGNDEYFSGALAYDNLSGLAGACGAITFVEPQGALNSPEYAFEVACANGIRQRVTPFVHDSAFYTEMAKNAAKVQTDRNTGIVSIESVGKFKAGFFVTPLNADEQAYFASNASGGIAIQTRDVNGDGINDIVLMTAKGGQALFGVD